MIRQLDGHLELIVLEDISILPRTRGSEKVKVLVFVEVVKESINVHGEKGKTMSDFKTRMIESYERGECSYEDSYDYVRESMADAADRARKQPRPGVFDLQRTLGHWPTAREYRDAGDWDKQEKKEDELRNSEF